MERAATQLMAINRARFSKRWTRLNFEIRSMIAVVGKSEDELMFSGLLDREMRCEFFDFERR